jgi:hypothetical protein
MCCWRTQLKSGRADLRRAPPAMQIEPAQKPVRRQIHTPFGYVSAGCCRRRRHVVRCQSMHSASRSSKRSVNFEKFAIRNSNLKFPARKGQNSNFARLASGAGRRTSDGVRAHSPITRHGQVRKEKKKPHCSINSDLLRKSPLMSNAVGLEEKK